MYIALIVFYMDLQAIYHLCIYEHIYHFVSQHEKIGLTYVHTKFDYLSILQIL